MTTGSNMTGAAGNTTGGTHGSSIPTTHRTGLPPELEQPLIKYEHPEHPGIQQ
jgi:hypothetical protein